MFETHTTFKHFVGLTNSLSGKKLWIELNSIIAFSEVWKDGKFSITEIFMKDIEPSYATVKETGEEILRKMQSLVSND